jgi:hypothetical protein
MRRLLLAALLAGWFSCSPSYESGKTKCSTNGECPNDWTCNSRGVCVTHDDSTGGRRSTGGASGSGGTTGLGGYCAPSATDTTCVTCGKSNCCSEYTACITNASCLTLASCYGACPDQDTSCLAACNSSYSAGVTPAVNLDVCLINYCPVCASGGTGGSTGGTGGSTGGSTGTAKVKFCHDLSSSSGQPLTYTLSVGGFTISATTGACQPTGSCLAVPAGQGIPVMLINGSTTVSTGTVDIEPGWELLIRADLNSDNYAIWKSRLAQGICSGGTSTSGTLAKFCNFLQKSKTDFLATLNLNGTRISAMSGTCSPIGSCSSITSGTDVPISLLDGSSSLASGTFPSIDAGADMLFLAELDDSDSATVYGEPYSPGICSPATASATLPDPVVPMTSVTATFRKAATSLVRSPTSAVTAPGLYQSVFRATR